METILVTGGAGFIGSHTCVELLNAGYKVIIMDNFVNSKPESIKRIKEITNKNPILLLDDIFDKLDDNRVSQLIELVNEQNFGQIFITDTHKERTESVVKRINEESRIFEI